jgi:hypothetical protein
MDFPLDAVTLMSLPGITVWVGAWMQLVKRYVPDGRWVPLCGIVLGMATSVGLRVILSNTVAPEPIIEALLIGFFGGLSATGGYETTQNTRGLTGRGPRA